MQIETFVELFTPDHPMADARGGNGFAGRLLRDVLQESGGRYEATAELSDRGREDVLRVAERTQDARLAFLATTNKFVVSLEHLRDLDPDVTRIVYGLQLHKEPGDGETPDIGP